MLFQKPIGAITLEPFEQQWAKLEGPAEQLDWLQSHRLLGVVPLLVERTLVSKSFQEMAEPLAKKRGRVSSAQLAEERRVLAGLTDAGMRCLCLKGVGLGWSVYPWAAQRWRGDLDLLVSPDELIEARERLTALGYSTLRQVEGGVPSCQETWISQRDGFRWAVDLHWALRNHPALRDCLGFEEQWAASVALEALTPGARRQSDAHALLNACMHWFDTLFSAPYPLVWLLDKDLLWREMTELKRQAAAELAVERGLAGLLAESLQMAQTVLSTPVQDNTINTLREAGVGQRATRLIVAGRHPVTAFLFSVRCEPDWRLRLRRLRMSLFPQSAYMRARYPAGSRWGLPGLYARRWIGR